MEQNASATVIDLTPYIRRNRCREWVYTALALWTQYLSLGALLLYGVLRAVLYPHVPVGAYSGPLAVLWAVSFFLLLTSYVSDLMLWREA